MPIYHYKKKSYQATILFEDKWSMKVFRSGYTDADELVLAKELVHKHYAHVYGNIAAYLKREDDAMDEDKKLHFVLYDSNGQLQGHQLIYGDGVSLIPAEALQPQVDVRFGSGNIFEVKRAVLLTKGKYHLLMQGLSAFLLWQFENINKVPVDHAIIGYSVQSAVVKYLINHGFELITKNDHESWIQYPTQKLLTRYNAKCDIVV